MGWHSIHVYYHGDQDHLVVHAVQPLLRKESGYYVRHWRRGPHVRVNIRGQAREAMGILGGYLARHPSVTVLDEQATLPLHAALARAEGDDGPIAPWLPDNSVHEAPYKNRAGELVADFYEATNGIAFAMAEQVLRGRQRLGTCFDLMVASAYAFSGGGLTRGFVSFRSHAEAFLATTPDAARYRAQWQDRYARAAAGLRDRIDAVLSTVDGASDAVPLVRDWVEALRPIHARAGALLADEPDPPPSTGGASPFHDALLAGPTYTREIRTAPWFRRYRVVLNLLYLQLTRHGVRPVDRLQLCHLAANAVEDRIGVTALDLVAGRATR
jgi:hypothetical protein